ncbi:hypothetical protein [Streptomyces sp. NBC_01803]|uniref:hypothetical protein n=1 Tax=Streptomyces sp. NBC_01803 TaxID=2975946 RepID=UPI002DD9B629|nr:hypothetical protein [Streptomyces sp. NBC_01803]WSA44967.1 hypothetical protein OIE51_12555 [Streptomyces sp. NBC_01803]
MTDFLASVPEEYRLFVVGLLLLVLLAAAWVLARAVAAARAGLAQTPGAVRVAAVAAVACTAYSGDTSWRFAAHHLDMVNTAERAGLFLAGELALFACALMARENVRQTETAGMPGVLVWAITVVQLVPAFAESGVAGGLLRAAFGPVGAAVLWHLAMGLEIRHERPDAASQGLLAILAREARERALSRLGVAARNRTAEQITRDRWTERAVTLAAELTDTKSGSRRARRTKRRLSRAVGRAGVGASMGQRRRLLELLAARRHSAALATIELSSPWWVPDPHPAGRSPVAVAGAQLRRMDPWDAVHLLADAHPDADAPELASIAVSHGVVVSANAVEIALRDAQPRALARASAAGQRRLTVHARYDPGEGTAAHSDDPDAHPDECDAELDSADEDGPGLDPDPLLDEARALDAAHLAGHGRPIGLRTLQRELRIGQRRAQRIRQQLDRAGE